eukprot:TRINITY_DN3062_c0_g1_i1.p1 TRINITY_DN3062_c0_g1~~TRINITY_DN3062_c0_g1_i1.p1  ORF type:complete len:219 (-),score=55.12 TRINITY_DN3062_c0_g1_i1:32-688(-)
MNKSNIKLIDQLIEKKLIRTKNVEECMKKVDRLNYSSIKSEAYEDRPHSLGYNVTISAPHMHAMALEFLYDKIKDKKNQRVLDVGVGSGYLAACFAHLIDDGGKVLGVDIIPQIVELARENLQKDCPQFLENGKIEIKLGDGWKSIEGKKFDAIHVGAAASTVPESLLEAMDIGARMIIPVGVAYGEQYLEQYDKLEDGKIVSKRICGVNYVPLIKQK